MFGTAPFQLRAMWLNQSVSNAARRDGILTGAAKKPTPMATVMQA